MSDDLRSRAETSLEPDGIASNPPVRGPLLSIVVPAYNEDARLGASLTRMLEYFDSQGYPFEILVVDDGSSDTTRAIAEQIAAERSEVRSLSYQPNHGKGYAVRYGMLRAAGDRVLFSDADLATPIEEVEHLSAALDAGNDVAIGSRDVAGSKLIRRQSFVREMGGRLFNKVVQCLAVRGIRDTQCGFKMFTKSACYLIFSRCTIDHFAFDVELLYLAKRVYGMKVAEVPVRWAHQDGSKVRFVRDAIRMLKTVVRIRMTRYDAAAAPAEVRL